ncbi:MAG: hypothetical protein ACRCSP_01855 [Rhodoglobus sp.]
MSAMLSDPVPHVFEGDPSVVGVKATMLSDTAQALRDAISGLRQLASSSVVISEAVDEVRTKATDAAGQIAKVELRYQGAADAMSRYRDGLADALNRAEAARSHIIRNNLDALPWRSRLAELTMRVEAGESSPELLQDIRTATVALTVYSGNFQDAMSQFHAAERDKDSAVATAIAALHFAAEIADLNDGVRDHVMLGLKAQYEWSQEHLAPLIENFRSVVMIVKAIVDVLAISVTVLAIFLPFLAPLAAALALASVALSAVVLMASLALFALGKESLGRVLCDAIRLGVGVITSKMGGLNVFKPGAKLAGLSNVFTRSAWSSGTSGMMLSFALNHGAMGATETVAGAAVQVGAKLFDPCKLTVKCGGEVLRGLSQGGLDIQLDFFPEGSNGGVFGPSLSGGWDLNAEERTAVWSKPVAYALTGGVYNPVVDFMTATDSLVSAS